MRIGEAATGIGEQMADTGLAIQRAKDKTEQMQARAGAVDELVAAGALEDFTSGDQTQLDRELAQLASQSQVDTELAKMKAELGAGAERRRRRAEGARAVIARILGTGQFEIADDLHRQLDALDERRARRPRAATRELDQRLAQMTDLVKSGTAPPGRLPRPVGDLIVPPADLSLEGDARAVLGPRADPGHPGRLAAALPATP